MSRESDLTELITYERIVNEYSAALAAQHDTIDRQNIRIDWMDCVCAYQKTRIAELEMQLSAALATIEKAAEDATGPDYAEECKP